MQAMPGDDEGDDGQMGDADGPDENGVEPVPTFAAAPDAPAEPPPPASVPQVVSEPPVPAAPAAEPGADGGPTGTPEGS